MANLFIEEGNDEDGRRVMLLATAGTNEYSKAILDTVAKAIEVNERALEVGAVRMSDQEIRYLVAALNTLKWLIKVPQEAGDYIRSL